MTSKNTDNIVQQEFSLDPDLIHLNHAAVGPWPKRTKDTVIQFADENSRLGSLHYPQWIGLELSLRKKIQQLINAPSHNDIALVKNTSEALSFVAYGIDWRPGDNIVITDQEFPSNHIIWQSLESQGVELRIAPITSYDSDEPEQSIISYCDSNTRLIAVSSIQYASGLKMDVNLLGKYCHSNDILFLIDAIQSIGVADFDLKECQAHFVMADGHKWMLGPEGVGFFYCDSLIRDQLKLTQYGWHMIEDMGNYDAQTWEAAKSARRFECGSPNMLGIHALNASLSLILELGLKEIEKRIKKNTELLLDEIKENASLTLISPSHIDRLGGIVTFKHATQDSNALYRSLMENKVLCAERGGGIRYSPHFYTDQSLITKALDLAARI